MLRLADPTENSPPEEEVAPEEVADDSLERLQARIDKLKAPERGDAKFARGVALVASLGFIVAGCVMGSYYLGNYLAKTYGSDLYMVGSLLGGLALGGYACFKLVAPFLEES